MSSVLYDVPGPRAIVRNRILGVVTVVVVAAILGFFLWRLYDTGQFTAEKWQAFTYTNVWIQIGLATLSGLSTFDAGLFQGDDGYVVRAELQTPFVIPITLPFALPSIPEQRGTGLPDGETMAGAVVISPYAFGAFGTGSSAAPA